MESVVSSEPSIPKLLSGILSDTEDLVNQRFALIHREVKEDIDNARHAGSILAVGAGISLIGLMLLCFMLVHLLASMNPDVELWMLFAAVGVPVTVMGVVFGFVGVHKFRS